MYSDKHCITPKLTWELFNEAKVLYNLCQDVSFRSYNVKFVNGTETLSYLRHKIWNLVALDIRDCTTEQIFRQIIKKMENKIDAHVGSAKYIFLI